MGRGDTSILLSSMCVLSPPHQWRRGRLARMRAWEPGVGCVRCGVRRGKASRREGVTQVTREREWVGPVMPSGVTCAPRGGGHAGKVDSKWSGFCAP